MQTYLLRRVLAVVPVMLVVATVTFILIHLAPGDPASIIAGPDATPENVARCACGSSGRRAGWRRDGLGTGAQGRGSEGAEGVDVAFAPTRE